MMKPRSDLRSTPTVGAHPLITSAALRQAQRVVQVTLCGLSVDCVDKDEKPIAVLSCGTNLYVQQLQCVNYIVVIYLMKPQEEQHRRDFSSRTD